MSTRPAPKTAPHPLWPAHGVNSPVGRAWKAGAQVLLLGVGHDANTTLHLAETLAGVGYGRAMYSTVLEGGDLVAVPRVGRLDQDVLGAHARDGVYVLCTCTV